MEIHTIEDMKKAARQIYSMGPRCVLLKGGHLSEDLDAKDILLTARIFIPIPPNELLPKIPTAPVAPFLPPLPPTWRWENLYPEAVSDAKHYITMAISHALELGKGHGPTHHFYEFYE